jgi:hypothetical protein
MKSRSLWTWPNWVEIEASAWMEVEFWKFLHDRAPNDHLRSAYASKVMFHHERLPAEPFWLTELKINASR